MSATASTKELENKLGVTAVSLAAQAGRAIPSRQADSQATPFYEHNKTCTFCVPLCLKDRY